VTAELSHFPLFDHFNLSLVKSLANQNLKDGSDLHVKVENGSCVDFILFVHSVKLRDENGVRGYIYVEVRFNLELIYFLRNI
jgi:hypothetical protein